MGSILQGSIDTSLRGEVDSMDMERVSKDKKRNPLGARHKKKGVQENARKVKEGPRGGKPPGKK